MKILGKNLQFTTNRVADEKLNVIEFELMKNEFVKDEKKKRSIHFLEAEEFK